MTDSTTAGYLTPDANPAPLEDGSLIGFFQQVVVGLTGLDGSLVRPRWQTQLPTPPDNTVTWVAIGVTHRKGDTFAFEGHAPLLNNGNGSDVIQRQEELTVLCSIYGPAADSTAEMLREGLSVEQNRAVLSASGMNLVSVGEVGTIPVMLNTQWYYRVDVPVHIRREIIRTYPVLTLLSSQGTVSSEAGSTILTDTFTVTSS